MYASNPQNGFFSHVIGFDTTNGAPAKEFFSKDAIFTNVGYTLKGEACWGSLHQQCASNEPIYDWLGNEWSNKSGRLVNRG
ncbi:unnamed protein product [Anisakis simplex]|uniref:Phosphoenolpyruvate carboxykinase C-terminal P-loop domain-containing protein n=2 Tax=Anisakis simplex TaxID=6269 RepID=A0A3P6NVB0_ANISI|nr:unnamed protein product [Anisakis simplex]